MSERLAIKGGRPVRTAPFPTYNTIGAEEKAAVAAVLDGGVLSKFLGTWSPDFYGGPRVQSLEHRWAEYFEVQHAVTVNSATSGLYAAVGACGISPGDEVIVTPYTMSASAAAILVYGGIPVFADIDPDTLCIDPTSIERKINEHTKAIMAVDLFGHPADFECINALAQQHGLRVIEDAAQAPGARLNGRYAGTLADIGVFSLNYHKHIHTGEGGVVVTDDADLAERVRLIRNHAETVVKDKGVEDIVNLVGFNYRLGEIEAAIAFEQLGKLEELLTRRISNVEDLTALLSGLRGITPPAVRSGARHAYYVCALRYDESETGVDRSTFVDAVNAEGIPMFEGYVEPLYMQPVYQRRIAFGQEGYPFSLASDRGHISYERGICPVAERMHERELVYTNVCTGDLKANDVDDIAAGVGKVLAHARELRT